MRERAICEAVTTWLRARGFDVHGEVELAGRSGRHDLVGLSPHEVVAVEAKASLSIDLRRQATEASERADRAWVAIPKRRRPLPPRDGRYGVLEVDGARVRETRRPRRHEAPWSGSDALRAACSAFTLDRPGGLSVSEGGATRSAYRCRVWEIHRRMWDEAGTYHASGTLLDLTADLFRHVKRPWSALVGILEREPCFSRRDVEGLTGYAANGHGVPPEAAPGLVVESVEQIHFPRRSR